MPLDFDPRNLAHDEKRFRAFVLTALSAILKAIPADESRTGKPTLYEEVVNNFEQRGVNWNAPVMTLPAMAGNGQLVPRLYTLLDFNGKTAAQLRAVDKLSEAQIDTVRQAFKAQGMTMSEGEADGSTQRAMRASHKAQPTAVAAVPAAETQPQGDAPAAAETTEPTFAGHPLSELADKTDADLLKIEGISRATIKEIRKAQATLQTA